MRRGYRKKVKRRIRGAVLLWIVGVIVSALVVFFASFWITSFVLQSGRDPVIPAQSDSATPPADTQTQNAEPSDSQTGGDTDKETDTSASSTPVDTGEPKKEVFSEKPETKPEETEKPKAEPKKEEAEKPATGKPPVEEKPSPQPSAEPEKPVTTPEPAPEPTPKPAKPTIEIISPNAG